MGKKNIPNKGKRQLIAVVGGTVLLIFFAIIILVFNNSSSDESDNESSDEEIVFLDYDMSGVTLTGTTVTYDGQEHSLEIDGDLPDGVSVSYTYNGEETTGVTDAGKYTVVASFQGDTSTYNSIDDMTALFVIDGADTDITGLSFTSSTLEYDGQEHSIEIEGNLSEDQSVSYTYDGNAATSISSYGVHTVVATISSSDSNYESQELTATLSITETTTFSFTTDVTRATITAYNGTDTDVVFPAYVCDSEGNEYPVNVIGPYVFGQSSDSHNDNVTSISITDGVISMQSYTFAYLDSLESVSFSETMTAISVACFYDCTNLKSVDLPSELIYLNSTCFKNCTSLESIEIPSTVKKILSSAFYNSGLTSVEIPDGVILGSSVFGMCQSLVTITFAGTVSEIGATAFYGTAITSIVIPDGVESIPLNCFYYAEDLESITLPDSITSIGNGAFLKCYSLETITIPSNVETIGVNCFDNCSSLNSIIFTDSTSSWNVSETEGGTGDTVSVDVSSTNASNFTDTYVDYYWNKIID